MTSGKEKIERLSAPFPYLLKCRKCFIAMLLCCSWWYSANAQFSCTDMTSAAGIDHHYLAVALTTGGGAAFFDLENDGDDDIWINGGLQMDALYKNNGDGTFTNIAMEAGIWATQFTVTTGVMTGDLDNDGFRDVLVLTYIGQPLILYKNNGDGTFSEVTPFTGPNGLGSVMAQSFAAAFGDVNLDGYLDIYIGTYVEHDHLIYGPNGSVAGFDHECYENWLFINNGDWTFTESGAAYGVNNNGCTLATTFSDFDLDADPDILVVNDFGEWVTPNTLFQNEYPLDTFFNIGQPSGMDAGIYGMGIATGDYDQDMDIDYYHTNIARNVLMANQGNAVFTDLTAEAGVEDIYMDSLFTAGWGTAFMDVDNDTDLDLFVCNGYIPAASFIANSLQNRNRLFINDGNATGTGYQFTESAQSAGLDDPGRGRGFAYSDIDNDGDLDMLVINANRQATSDPIQKVKLFRNDLVTDDNWLNIKLVGVTNNRDAFGATIKIRVGDRSWVHDYNGGFGTHASQNSSIAHFGLSDASKADSLIVTWPGGAQTILTNIRANQWLTIPEDLVITKTAEPANIPDYEKIKLTASPNPFSDKTTIRFQLENDGFTEVEIFDALGVKSYQLLRAWLPAGPHSIEYQVINKEAAYGWSFIRLIQDGHIATLKIMHSN